MSLKTPDWIAIEGLYRAGVQSLREIAKETGTVEGTIRSRAKKLGWVRDVAGTKRRLVTDGLSGVTQGVTQCAMREIESAAAEDVKDMVLGLKGARAILQSAVDSIGLQGVHTSLDGSKLELVIEPKDLKVLSECIKINVETIRTIRELNAPIMGAPGGAPITIQIALVGGAHGQG